MAEIEPVQLGITPSSVKGPKHVVRKGKTPVLSVDEARELLAGIDVSSPVGLRDRALVALMVYTFARIGAAIKMRVEDVYVQGRQRSHCPVRSERRKRRHAD